MLKNHINFLKNNFLKNNFLGDDMIVHVWLHTVYLIITRIRYFFSPYKNAFFVLPNQTHVVN